MNDLVVGIGLVLVIEGMVWALVPHLAQRFLETAAAASESFLRWTSLSMVAVGLFLVWLARG